ncbi:ABC transporter substrate-binding protein [Atopomonas sediminilitoris]|uniref:ABC transporter substrate-binding protein n=1 Tax=Atopomonas sediminilitoris TaxID=2919919 RepID=UPI001F4DC55A|nr:ABC transporter substrate-binding protein [Atopomonas sediminilitoris]MCJ8167772.1 ABC transporter substrate-binding protein [Atopomonas sediminilitoris]
MLNTRMCQRWIAAFALLLSSLLCSSLSAQTLYVISEQDSPAVQDFVRALAAKRPHDAVKLAILNALTQPNAELPPSTDSQSILLGRKSLAWHLAQQPQQPALAMLISRQEASSVLQEQPPQLTLLWREAPAMRQLRLGQLLMPRSNRVGLLYHQDNHAMVKALTQQANTIDLKLSSRAWNGQFPSSEVQRVLDDSQWLLALDDPRLFNAQTIKPLLLGAYRQQRVLIGPQAGYVQAGSLASTYSDQADWLQQLDELLNLAADQRPRSAYARYFKVAINPQVARSLGISNADPDTLANQLRQGESP